MISHWTQPATEKKGNVRKWEFLAAIVALAFVKRHKLFNEYDMMTHIFHVSCCIFNRLNLCYCAISWRWLFERLCYFNLQRLAIFFYRNLTGFLVLSHSRIVAQYSSPFFGLFSVLIKARMDISFCPIKCCLAKTSSLVNACHKKSCSCKCMYYKRFGSPVIIFSASLSLYELALFSSSSNWFRWFSQVENSRIWSTRNASFEGLFLSFVPACHW